LRSYRRRAREEELEDGDSYLLHQIIDSQGITVAGSCPHLLFCAGLA
jgi:hypothetical protein